MSKELHTLHVNNTLESFLPILLPLLAATLLTDADAATQEEETSDDGDRDHRRKWHWNVNKQSRDDTSAAYIDVEWREATVNKLKMITSKLHNYSTHELFHQSQSLPY